MIAQKTKSKSNKKSQKQNRQTKSKLSYAERKKIVPLLLPARFRNGVPGDYRIKFFNYANTYPIVAKRQFLFDVLHQIDAIYRKGVTCKRHLTDLVYWYGQLGFELKIEFSLLD